MRPSFERRRSSGPALSPVHRDGRKPRCLSRSAPAGFSKGRPGGARSGLRGEDWRVVDGYRWGQPQRLRYRIRHDVHDGPARGDELMVRCKPLPSQDLLKALLDYNPENGVLTWLPRSRAMFTSDRIWRSWNTRYSGQRAFTSVNQNGYFQGVILGAHYLAHRVIWKWVQGHDPDQVDHEEGRRRDNRWVNLRDATDLMNQRNKAISRNNSSGVMGVDQVKGRWRARISGCVLGTFDTLEEATLIRKAAEPFYGFHPNHGRAA